MTFHRLLAALLGSAMGDALGVPHEFKSREELMCSPCKGMEGWGTHSQPLGTVSDDTSMTYATVQAFVDFGVSDLVILQIEVARNFVSWFAKGKFLLTGENLFDIGNTTQGALVNYLLAGEVDPDTAYTQIEDFGIEDNLSQGNGSLMRILPVSLYLAAYEGSRGLLRGISAITHNHPVCHMSIEHYTHVVALLLNYPDKPFSEVLFEASNLTIGFKATPEFKRVSSGDLLDLPEYEIRSTGYVVDTLEAIYWVVGQAFKYSLTFEEAILVAVNLGGDTDTIGSLVGGLIGLVRGLSVVKSSPWYKQVPNINLLETLYKEFEKKVIYDIV